MVIVEYLFLGFYPSTLKKELVGGTIGD